MAAGISELGTVDVVVSSSPSVPASWVDAFRELKRFFILSTRLTSMSGVDTVVWWSVSSSWDGSCEGLLSFEVAILPG